MFFWVCKNVVYDSRYVKIFAVNVKKVVPFVFPNRRRLILKL